jgi:hypothetical protein
MKYSNIDINSKTHAIPDVRFEEEKLTSFGGLVVFQLLLKSLNLKHRLRLCLERGQPKKTYGHATIVLLLVVHIALGYRRLSDVKFYQHDPMMKHLHGLNSLPDDSTLSRRLNSVTQEHVDNLATLMQKLVVDRCVEENLTRITLDFDGSVISSKRYAEGSAIGYNKKNKGQRSYYPLFCTVAQTGQVFDLLYRSGNVHDSNGAHGFILANTRKIRQYLSKIAIEVRMDSAFFSDEIITLLNQQNVEFTISVPFERHLKLKNILEQKKAWSKVDNTYSTTEISWSPKSWAKSFRIIGVQRKDFIQHKGVVQLDLFIPYKMGYTYSVIVTNKKQNAKRVMECHQGRGSQEGLFAELKSQAQMDYIPVKKQAGNHMYMLCTVMAHNLNRELQMKTKERTRKTNAKRAAFWGFDSISRVRNTIFIHAGRSIRPNGEFVLSMNSNDALKNDMEKYFTCLN